MLKRGEVDIAYSIRGALAQELTRTPGLTLKPVAGTFTEWLSLTEQWDPKSPWHDQRVRLAANLAINRKALNEAEYLGHGRLSASIIPRDLQFAWSAPAYPYDPDRARRLLLRRLFRHRRALPGPGARDGREEARGDPPPHPAARARKGDVRPHRRGGLPERTRRPRGRAGPGAHRRPPLLGALRGPAPQEVARLVGA